MMNKHPIASAITHLIYPRKVQLSLALAALMLQAPAFAQDTSAAAKDTVAQWKR